MLQDLTKSKIEIQEKYIEDTKTIEIIFLSEKTNIIDANNEEEILRTNKEKQNYKKRTNTF